MEKRIGTISILVSDTEIIPKINQLLSDAGGLILARQGLPIREYELNFISLIIEGNINEINALTGRLGRLPHVEAKSMLSKIKI
ncbi:MAG: CopG family transcriptional regulator [Bacteroidales bacterium]|nr:CopG family transcriptional regulator [Bacteroidales bacterium]